MKRIKEVIAEGTKVIVFMSGLILCMCETSDLTKQIYVLLTGVALMEIVVLSCLLKEWRETWQTN